MENTMNVKEATNAHDEHQNGLAVPEAKRVPKERTFHGDTFIDNYEWLRDKESQDVRDYVAAQNRYCEQRMAPLASLRKTLFEEFKSHVQETDMSVPTRMDGYWYFTRTKQGEQYAVQCRVPIRGADDWDPPTVEADAPLDGEQVVFDTNVEAEGHDFFRLGGMDISKDGRWMLYGTTREATNGTISASAILRPATSWRNGSRASAAPASRRTRNGCSTCCSTAHGVRTR